MLNPHDDFDQLTAYHAKCAACSNIKLKEHTTVFRPDIEDDFDGFHDICQACIEQAAHDLGMQDADRAQYTQLALTEAELLRDQSDRRYNEGVEAIMVVTRENVNMQATIDRLLDELTETAEQLEAEREIQELPA